MRRLTPKPTHSCSINDQKNIIGQDSNTFGWYAIRPRGDVAFELRQGKLEGVEIQSNGAADSALTLAGPAAFKLSQQ